MYIPCNLLLAKLRICNFVACLNAALTIDLILLSFKYNSLKEYKVSKLGSITVLKALWLRSRISRPLRPHRVFRPTKEKKMNLVSNFVMSDTSPNSQTYRAT